MPAHADSAMDGARTASVRIGPGSANDTWSVRFESEAVPGTLAAFAGTLAVAGLDIVLATVRRSTDSVVDTFEVIPLDGRVLTAEDEVALAAIAAETLNGRRNLAGELALLRRAHVSRADVEPEVEIRADSAVTSGIEIVAADRLGLLHDLAATISEHGLRVRALAALTIAGRARDAFRVVDSAGQPPTDPALLATLRERLFAVCAD